MRNVLLRLFAFLLLLPCAACQQRMAVQPSYRPDEASSFFPDGRSDRPLVPGTVARGHLRTDVAFFTGQRTAAGPNAGPAAAAAASMAGPLAGLAIQAAREGNEVDTFPFPVTREVLRFGQNRYTIYCVVCHDPLGTGRGKIVERGYTAPPSYHIDRLRQAPVGHFFRVMTEGYGSMPDYRQQIPVLDRWAIAAYIRALQLSQHFPEKELTTNMRRQLDRGGGELAKRGRP